MWLSQSEQYVFVSCLGILSAQSSFIATFSHLARHIMMLNFGTPEVHMLTQYLSTFTLCLGDSHTTRSVTDLNFGRNIGDKGLYTCLFHQQKLGFRSFYVGPSEGFQGSRTKGWRRDPSQPLKSSFLGEGCRSPGNLTISPSTRRIHPKSSILGQYLRPTWRLNDPGAIFVADVAPQGLVKGNLQRTSKTSIPHLSERKTRSNHRFAPKSPILP